MPRLLSRLFTYRSPGCRSRQTMYTRCEARRRRRDGRRGGFLLFLSLYLSLSYTYLACFYCISLYQVMSLRTLLWLLTRRGQ